MRLSSLFTKTSKETASDAASRNADLLTRAGFIHKTMAGVYSYLPLGARVLRKIEDCLREEMDKIGCEVFLPSLSPTEFWEKTGRLESVGVLFQATPANALSKKTHDSRYILNSTHEEVITPLFQSFCESYKDLPRAAYQIQTKFRNEPRAKSGIMRGREFRMKDLYSFHATEEDMLDYFLHTAIPAYRAFFERIGLGGDRTVIVLASGGEFSKEPSREFQTRCENGEDSIFHAPGSDIYYNREIAPSGARLWDNTHEELLPRKDVIGKGIIGVEELAAYLKIEVERTTKTLLFQTDDGRVIAAAVRGEYDVNESKLREVAGCRSLTLATAKTVKRVTRADVGYAGPLGLPPDVSVYWDDSTRGRRNFECGANKTDYHSINVNFGRDLPDPEKFYDIKVAREGDLDPESHKAYEVFRAAEVGNVFTLYRKFSDAFGLRFRDAGGTEKPVYMGSYGIGTTRVMGVLAEVFNDEHGLCWPANVAPARVHVVAIAKTKDEEAYGKAEELYERLEGQGIDCLFDDRLGLTVGSRLADADLIGVPTRVIVSAKTMKNEGVEVKDRRSGTISMMPLEELIARECSANK
ncbi:proline--tRNA ligase [Candidatus Peregrinibacteria bacterium]|nr:proline--tRNA ligase [Candidatus Peregrinibacteria bacterium]